MGAITDDLKFGSCFHSALPTKISQNLLFKCLTQYLQSIKKFPVHLLSESHKSAMSNTTLCQACL